MKTVKAYMSEKGNVLYTKKSEARAADIKHAVFDAVNTIYKNKKTTLTPAGTSLNNALINMLESGVHPGKLAYEYRKLWRLRQQWKAALEEERIEEEIPF